jgi:hypothetical protein
MINPNQSQNPRGVTNMNDFHANLGHFYEDKDDFEHEYRNNLDVDNIMMFIDAVSPNNCCLTFVVQTFQDLGNLGFGKQIRVR